MTPSNMEKTNGYIRGLCLKICSPEVKHTTIVNLRDRRFHATLCLLSSRTEYTTVGTNDWVNVNPPVWKRSGGIGVTVAVVITKGCR